MHSSENVKNFNCHHPDLILKIINSKTYGLQDVHISLLHSSRLGTFLNQKVNIFVTSP